MQELVVGAGRLRKPICVEEERFDRAMRTQCRKLLAAHSFLRRCVPTERAGRRLHEPSDDRDRRTCSHPRPLRASSAPKSATPEEAEGEVDEWYAPRDSNPEPSD